MEKKLKKTYQNQIILLGDLSLSLKPIDLLENRTAAALLGKFPFYSLRGLAFLPFWGTSPFNPFEGLTLLIDLPFYPFSAHALLPF